MFTLALSRIFALVSPLSRRTTSVAKIITRRSSVGRRPSLSPHSMPPSRTTVVTRRTSSNDELCITSTVNSDFITVTVVHARSRETFVGYARGSDAPFERWLDVAERALGDARDDLITHTFTFAFDDISSDVLGTTARELSWEFTQRHYDEAFATSDERASIGERRRRDGDEYERRSVGVITLFQSEQDVGEKFAVANAFEEAKREAMELRNECERSVAANVVASERAAEAVKALEMANEDLSRRFVALLNAKKHEIQRLSDKLEAAEDEIEDLKRRAERATESGAAPSRDGGFADASDEDASDDAYATDDERAPTQAGERVSMRKKFAPPPQLSQPSQRALGARRDRSAFSRSDSPTREEENIPSPKPTRGKKPKNKSFLANALLDCLDTD